MKYIKQWFSKHLNNGQQKTVFLRNRKNQNSTNASANYLKSFQIYNSEKIYHQQICMTRNMQGNPLGGRKMILDENIALNKGMKSTRNGKLWISKKISFLLFKFP